MKDIISSPMFSIMISLIAFEVACIIKRKTRLEVLNPLLISIIFLIIFLKVFNISVSDYNNGGQFISFLLSPATVVLAVPLYKKIKLLKANAVPILAGITVGTLCGITSVVLLCKLFRIPKRINLSMMPKSITTPIGMAVSKQIGGITAITVAAIIITGVFGAIIGPTVFKIFKINDKVARGVALGNSCHAIGTTKAIELGEVEGAMSSLTIGVNGLITVILAPILAKIFQSIF
ncbi:LrgB family protein [Clostridium hydrogenum]|uniref:LrgB family protein n=1 Tax=Clostridium hydrogenum TaxID=2855764 RepID=UPI001F33CBD2|nr:LrgB family protein [Clostridium hydrogenum]